MHAINDIEFFQNIIENLVKENRSQQVDEDKFKQLVKEEIKASFKKISKGIDKGEFLTLIKKIFGSHNFQNEEYIGDKEVILNIVYDFFGEENFRDNKYMGG